MNRARYHGSPFVAEGGVRGSQLDETYLGVPDGEPRTVRVVLAIERPQTGLSKS